MVFILFIKHNSIFNFFFFFWKKKLKFNEFNYNNTHIILLYNIHNIKMFSHLNFQYLFGVSVEYLCIGIRDISLTSLENLKRTIMITKLIFKFLFSLIDLIFIIFYLIIQFIYIYSFLFPILSSNYIIII